MQLYSIYFTEKKIVSKYDAKGKKCGEYVEDIPRTMHALPLSTAMQYKSCDNFRHEIYVMTSNERSNGAVNYRARNNGTSAGNYTRKAEGNFKLAPAGNGIRKGEMHLVASATKTGRSTINHAAMTGDMAAAINSGE